MTRASVQTIAGLLSGVLCAIVMAHPAAAATAEQEQALAAASLLHARPLAPRKTALPATHSHRLRPASEPAPRVRKAVARMAVPLIVGIRY